MDDGDISRPITSAARELSAQINCHINSAIALSDTAAVSSVGAKWAAVSVTTALFGVLRL